MCILPHCGREIPRRVRVLPFSCSSRARGSRSSPIRGRPTLNSPPPPLCPFQLFFHLGSLHLRLASTPTLVGASRSPLPRPPKVRAEISSSAGSFQLSTLNLRPLVPNFSSRFPPACAVRPMPCAVHPPFLLSLHIPQSIQTFGLTNFT